jgi:ATP-dependent RNA helicase DDX3X
MRSSWADSVANAEESAPATGAAPTPVANHQNSRPTRSAYVPPHLRGQAPTTTAAPAPAPGPAAVQPSASVQPSGYAAIVGGSRWAGPASGDGTGAVGGPRQSVGGRGGGGGGGGGWNSRPGWDRRDREPNPFANSEAEEATEVDFDTANTGINFDAYEDIPVETSGHDVPPPVNTFAEIDLGDALNENIRRCKYVKPTPVQRYAIPISIAGRDLMACAQTGSGKTAAFCFPIISGIMSSRPPQRPRGSRTAYPLALILSPTRELSVQVRFPLLFWFGVGHGAVLIVALFLTIYFSVSDS